MSEAIQSDYGKGQGSTAVFLHANGFAPRVYTPFLDRLSQQFQVFAPSTRPLNGFPLPEKRFGWNDLGREAAGWIGKNIDGPVIGIGHSMGATAMIYAAQRHPKTFRALVVIEPASVSAGLAFLIRLMPFAWLKRMQPMKGAAQKRDRWDNVQGFLQSCERSGMYKNFDARAMKFLCEHAIGPRTSESPEKSKVFLKYPKMWEAYNYSQVCNPIPALQSLEIPVIGIRADDSFFMDQIRWQRFVSSPSVRWNTKLDGYGHLVPLEGPEVCANAVFEGLAHLGIE